MQVTEPQARRVSRRAWSSRAFSRRTETESERTIYKRGRVEGRVAQIRVETDGVRGGRRQLAYVSDTRVGTATPYRKVKYVKESASSNRGVSNNLKRSLIQTETRLTDRNRTLWGDQSGGH